MFRMILSATALFLLLLSNSVAARHAAPQGRAFVTDVANYFNVEVIWKTPFPGSHLYVPRDGQTSHPGIITLHGSDGGLTDWMDTSYAIPLAAKGYAVLAFDYFHSPGLPRDIAKIPLERVLRAADWLKKSGHVQGKPALVGASWGAMFAVVLAQHDRGRRFSALGVHAAHATLVQGYRPPPDGSNCGLCGSGTGPAFTYRGKALKTGPIVQLWKFPGPVLLSHGANDTLWLASESRTLATEARKHGKRNVKLVVWANQSHVLRDGKQELLINRLAAFFRKPTR